MSTTPSGRCMGCMSPLGDYTTCPHCGYDNNTPSDKRYRKPGSMVGEQYLLGRVTHQNGECITYVGFDNHTQKRVWIKEYFPSKIVRRDADTGDVVPLDGLGAQFKTLLSDYVDTCNEVKRLADTEPLIPVEQVLGENGTVYAVYSDLGAVPLEDWLAEQGGKLSVAEARSLLLPLFYTLSNLHARGAIHRGVSPQTVYVDDKGKLYLWGFSISAARTQGSELEAELYNGYSAPEQYSATGWQGTWTDVYSAAALFYRVVSGFVPPKSTMIGPTRPLAPLSDLVMEIPANISDAVADAMNPVAERRTQEMGAFVAQLVQTDLSSTAIYDVNKVHEVKQKQEMKKKVKEEKRRRNRYIAFGLLITVVVLFVAIFVVMRTFFPGLFGGGRQNDRPQSSQTETGSEDDDDDEDDLPDNATPDFTGLVAQEVMDDPAYQARRFQFSIREENNSQYDEGVVYDQSPSPGTVIQDGRTIILYVSKGERKMIMPDLIGKNRQEAIDELLRLAADAKIDDFVYNTLERVVPDAEPNTIVSTTPVAGTEFDPTVTSVLIFVMPDVSTGVNEASQVDRNERSSQSSEQSSRSSSRGSGTSESSRMTVEEFERQWEARDR